MTKGVRASSWLRGVAFLLGGGESASVEHHPRATSGDRAEGRCGKVGLMAARLQSVAKYICERSGWSVSNLQLQKLIYLAQMIHMGRNRGNRLFEGDFQAWDYGPIEPRLYQKVKIFGSGYVQDVFTHALDFDFDDPRREVMDDVCDRFLKFSGGDLVEITHWDNGAWAKNYIPGARNIPIPDEDILSEYQRRNRNAA